MKVIEFNNGVWIEYPDDFDAPVLIFDDSRYISIEQYCAAFGIKVDSVRVQDGNLLITSARPIPFNTIAWIFFIANSVSSLFALINVSNKFIASL